MAVKIEEGIWAVRGQATTLKRWRVRESGVGYVIFLLVPVRWAFRWAARRSGSLESGNPTAMMMTLTLVLVFISAFFTDIIGIHAIFGTQPSMFWQQRADTPLRWFPCWLDHPP